MSAPYNHIHQRLTARMIEGQMHETLRDNGRLTGGLLASGSLTRQEADSLREHAISLAIDRKLAEVTWDQAVQFGQRDPLPWDRLEWRPCDVIGWEDVIGERDYRIVDPGFVEPAEMPSPDQDWDPADQVRRFINALFKPEEFIGYCLEHTEGDKAKPLAGVYTRTAAQVLSDLERYKGTQDALGFTLGDYDKDVGGWARINPLDGQGCKDANVVDFRHALVESDDAETPPEKQLALYQSLKLPCALVTHSGGKSMHAIVKVEAQDLNEYRQRVNFLHEVCAKNGLKVDTQNKNPSRYSRLPGLERNGAKQCIVAENTGLGSWKEWQDHVEDLNDEMPAFESLASVWDKLPDVSPPLIEGMVRQGHKMLIAGPSKAGKSFLLIELCIAIAEGREWLGRKCTQGRVLYVNLELDRASCLRRFELVYKALGWSPNNLKSIDIWNLRGKSVPMDKLAAKLIRRTKEQRAYSAVVIDPIYKVLTGEENDAADMAHFCNQFDKVCHSLEAAVIYCHHHSKGLQGQKRAIDRSSGSGVFARDPDAVIDLIELYVGDQLMSRIENDAVCNVIARQLDRLAPGWRERIKDMDMYDQESMLSLSSKLLDMRHVREVLPMVPAERVALMTAWQAEGALREFPRLAPIKFWFSYPVHSLDKSGDLRLCEPHKFVGDGADDSEKRQTIESLVAQGINTVKEIASQLGKDKRTISSWITKWGKKGWSIQDGTVYLPGESPAKEQEAQPDMEDTF